LVKGDTHYTEGKTDSLNPLENVLQREREREREGETHVKVE